MGKDFSSTRPGGETFLAPMKIRRKLQGVVLAWLVVALAVTVMRIYEAQMARTPLNLKGNIATEGGITANPPAAAPQ